MTVPLLYTIFKPKIFIHSKATTKFKKICSRMVRHCLRTNHTKGTKMLFLPFKLVTQESGWMIHHLAYTRTPINIILWPTNQTIDVKDFSIHLVHLKKATLVASLEAQISFHGKKSSMTHQSFIKRFHNMTFHLKVSCPSLSVEWQRWLQKHTSHHFQHKPCDLLPPSSILMKIMESFGIILRLYLYLLWFKY